MKKKGYELIIAIDISKSMNADDIYPSRLEVAKKKAKEILNLNSGNRVGILAFSSSSFIISPLTQDIDTAKYLLENLNANSVSTGGTNLLSALEASENMLKNSDKKSVIILSDGGDSSDLNREIEYAKENKIAVYSIGIGTQKGSPIKDGNTLIKDKNGNIVIAKLNENIKTLCLESGGAYIQSSTSNIDVEDINRDIKSKSKKIELDAQKIKDYEEYFIYPLSFALLVLLLGFSSLPKALYKNSGIIKGLIFVSIIFSATSSKAFMLDFLDIEQAKESYKEQKYKEAIKNYENIIKDKKTPEALFNLGDSYYKDGDYKKALEIFGSIGTEDEGLNAKKLHNIGNSKLQLGDIDGAISAYEKSLKLKSDADTKFNLELAKKLKKEQKKQKENKQDKKNSDKNSQNREKDKNQEKNDKKDSEQNKQNSKEQNQDKQNGDEKKQNDKNRQESEKKEGENKNSEDKNEQKQEEKNKKDGEKDKNQEKNDKNEQNSANEAQKIENKDISDLEEKKWIDILNKRKMPTYLYRVPTKPETQEQNSAW